MSTIGVEYAFLPRKKAKYKVINNKNRKRVTQEEEQSLAFPWTFNKDLGYTLGLFFGQGNTWGPCTSQFDLPI